MAERDSIITKQLTRRSKASTSKPRLGRTGPKLRTPRGGYRHAATAASASSGVSTSGTITPSAPASSTRPIAAGSLRDTRTTLGIPAASSGRSSCPASASLSSVCWQSIPT